MRFACLALLLSVAACAGAQAPPSRPLELQAGVAALEGGAAPAALLIARRQLAVDRDNVEALLIQGKALADMGQDERAMASFSHAAAVRPSSAAAPVRPGSAAARLRPGRRG